MVFGVAAGNIRRPKTISIFKLFDYIIAKAELNCNPDKKIPRRNGYFHRGARLEIGVLPHKADRIALVQTAFVFGNLSHNRFGIDTLFGVVVRDGRFYRLFRQYRTVHLDRRQAFQRLCNRLVREF